MGRGEGERRRVLCHETRLSRMKSAGNEADEGKVGKRGGTAAFFCRQQKGPFFGTFVKKRTKKILRECNGIILTE